MGNDIAVIVVTHQSGPTIDDCLDRLRAAQGVVQIRVVDNDSRDDTLSIVQRHAATDPRVRFIANPDNPGFAVACNQGAVDSTATTLAFVNPDCLVEAGTFARMAAHVATVDGGWLLGADLVDEDGVRDAAARRHEPDFAHMLRTASQTQTAITFDPARALQPVDAVSGALMLMPRQLFARIGGFDPSYRLHAEDLDLCRRARDGGALVAVANDVQVLHLRGVSSRARPVFVEWHKHRGLMRYFNRYEAGRRGLPTRVAVRLLIWLRFPFAVLRAWLRR